MGYATPAGGRPSIAAVIPAHNRERLIERAIGSVLAQERPADEVIVVDDGSSDQTGALVEQYGDRVTLISQPQSGVSVARNTGVEKCSSDFIAFLDSDDIWNAFASAADGGRDRRHRRRGSRLFLRPPDRAGQTG